MRTPDFFIQKAERYIKEGEQIQQKQSEKTPIEEFSSNDVKSIFDVIKRRENEVEEYLIRVKLMFGEFDNSRPFLDRMESLRDPESVQTILKKLPDVRVLLELFIEHIKEWRLEE